MDLHFSDFDCGNLFTHKVKEKNKMINTVVLSGRLTKDPELKETNSGKKVVSFNLAVNRRFQNEDQQADFFPCVAWNKTAEVIAQYCAKGSQIGIEGRLQQRTYENSQGQKVYVVEVLCGQVTFLESKKESQGHQIPQYTEPTYTQPKEMMKAPDPMCDMGMNESSSFNIMEDDLQF